MLFSGHFIIEPMTHTDLVDRLKEMAKGTDADFLQELESIHDDWHTTREFDGQPVGFLSFHRELIKYYKACLKKNGKKIPPAARAKSLHVPYQSWIDGMSVAEEFSQAIENWHNSLHRLHSDLDFLDPRINIHMPFFWSFHQFINNRFSKWMKTNNEKFSDIDHEAV